jgi:hypothetical protein
LPNLLRLVSLARRCPKAVHKFLGLLQECSRECQLYSRAGLLRCDRHESAHVHVERDNKKLNFGGAFKNAK